MNKNLPTNNEILVLTSYPPRECGIATFSEDLITAFSTCVSETFNVSVCALENGNSTIDYPKEVKYVLDTSNKEAYHYLAKSINNNPQIKAVLIEHEFGLFGGEYGEYLMYLMYLLEKPIVIAFHTVLPNPDSKRSQIVNKISQIAASIIVMTKDSATILKNEYEIDVDKINIIPHGTHPIEYKDKGDLRNKYGYGNRKILSTFGLISSNKNIENALEALPDVVKKHPEVLYLIIGKTHPEVMKQEEENYREFLEQKIMKLELQNNVLLINRYINLPELLDLLQMSVIYIFTSKDRNQAVSGTFAYALSCGCPVIATSIPHAKELLSDNTGILIDFEEPKQLSKAILQLLGDSSLCDQISSNAIHKTKTSEWNNVALKHAQILKEYISSKSIVYDLPPVSLKHLEKMTHDLGILQFSQIDTPDQSSGYTLDDNARALIAITMNYELTKDSSNYLLIDKYLRFIATCQKENGKFINYLDISGAEKDCNQLENMEDSNGRALWALGILISYSAILPPAFIFRAKKIFFKALPRIKEFSSPRAIAFSIKGLYYFNLSVQEREINDLINTLADNISAKYYDVKDEKWLWYEDYLTYGNSILPESMLYAYLSNKNGHFKAIAKISFDFLLSHTFIDEKIKVISNNGWLKKNSVRNMDGGEQPIEIAYTIQTLQLFHAVFNEEHYREKMETAFSWFLGKNHLNQMLYNSHTGGCHDGLEKSNVNLNQGAESTVCYLIARFCIEKNRKGIAIIKKPIPILKKQSIQISNQGKLTIIY